VKIFFPYYPKKQVLICAAAYQHRIVNSISYKQNFSIAKFFLLPLWKPASPSSSFIAAIEKPQRISLRLPSFLIDDLG